MRDKTKETKTVGKRENVWIKIIEKRERKKDKREKENRCNSEREKRREVDERERSEK